MSLFSGLKVSAQALRLERLRMNVIAENIANAETTRTPQGGPYRRQQVVVMAPASTRAFPSRDLSFPSVRIVADPTPPRLMWDPAHPDADANGYVRMPNVDVPLEIVDLMTATRAYEANAAAFAAQRQSQERTLELLA